MDPWASPADASKPVTRPVNNDQTPSGPTAARPVIANTSSTLRTTSAFTTHGEAVDADTDDAPSKSGSGGDDSGMSSAWGSMGNSGSGFSNSVPGGIGGPGFGSGNGGDGNPSRPGRPLGGGRSAGSQGAQEIITITCLPEKEGMFMFQHRNYEVKSARRGSSVIRRYSDFVWLLDCLHKRYPFRQLPLLPPKTLARRLAIPLLSNED